MIQEYPILNTETVHPSISLYINVDDLDALYDDLSSRIAIYTEAHVSPYGTREFAITDVDGYVLTFAEKVE